MGSSNGAIRVDQIATIAQHVLKIDRDLAEHPPKPLAQLGRELVDSLLCTADDQVTSAKIFKHLRWGGQVVFAAAHREQAVKFGLALADCGFEITHQPAHVSRGWLGLPILSRKTWYVIGRKVELIQPGENTDRFTYHVYLKRSPAKAPAAADAPTIVAPSDCSYEVVEEVPTLDMVMARLHSKWPDLAQDVIEKRARKFSERVFPIFLTREAAILKLVNRDLPSEYRGRMPRLIRMEKDSRGYAKKLHLNWLRNGGTPLTQLEFARQSADLLRVLHDKVGVMHLDLRLDNFVITPAGVGFVDFGSAVRVDENLKESPLLSSMFEELMRTSEIQRMLFSMTKSGQVTSSAIACGLHKVDKAVDYFYLAVQINSPHKNPELRDLILYDRTGPQAKMLSHLTERILRPSDPGKPAYGSAADILKGIEQIQHTLESKQPVEA